MTKWTTITKEGDRLIAVFAGTESEAERVITIQLRGRPGCIDYYKRWTKDGKLITKN